MPDPTHFEKLENMMHSAPFVKLVGAKVVERAYRKKSAIVEMAEEEGDQRG
jgi:hypothetical protein